MNYPDVTMVYSLGACIIQMLPLFIFWVYELSRCYRGLYFVCMNYPDVTVIYILCA